MTTRQCKEASDFKNDQIYMKWKRKRKEGK